MASFWQRVTVQTRTVLYTDIGAPVWSWSDYLADVEARLSPLAHTEALDTWATPEEEAYEVHLRGAQQVEPLMRVVNDDAAYDVRKVMSPPPFGTPTTVLYAVRVTP